MFLPRSVFYVVLLQSINRSLNSCTILIPPMKGIANQGNFHSFDFEGIWNYTLGRFPKV